MPPRRRKPVSKNVDDDGHDEVISKKKKTVKSSNGKSASDSKQERPKRAGKQLKVEVEEDDELEVDHATAVIDSDNDEVVPKKRKTAKSRNKKSGSDGTQQTKKNVGKQLKKEVEEESEVEDAMLIGDYINDGVVPKKRETAKSNNGSQPKAKKAGKQTKKQVEDDEELEVDDAKPIIDTDKDEVVPKKRKTAKNNGKSDGDGNQQQPEKSGKLPTEVKKEAAVDVKTVIIKGKAPVDSHCVKKINIAHVFCEEHDVWDAMLNQTNLQFNNNKYYLLQLLKDDEAMNYSVWFRWGRVGNKGQNKLVECESDLEKAKKLFREKFQEKTKNSWDERDSFEKVSGKYDLLKMDYSATEAKDEVDAPGEPKKEIKIPACTLDKRVQSLIELICNVKAMEEAVLEMKYDAQKAPLGKLTNEQITAGYVALKEIEELISVNAAGPALVQACNNFYTRIPHNFGMKVPPLIRNKVDIIEKLNLLEALGDIQIAMKMLNEASTILENPVDSHYKHLDCTLSPIEKDSEIFNVIKEYLENTHEKTHSHYKMVLEDVFECNKQDETKKFIKHPNRMLLWHGSRLTNYVGILKQGLRIAPPEAPVTGYMFGKGVYFADRASKSANYCCTTRSNNTGLMLLCEVSLGNIHELLQSDYNADRLPKGKHSVKGLGTVVPDPAKQFKMEDGTIVPYGKGCSASNTDGMTLNYNEYIVYDTKRIKMRYLVKVKFVFK